MLRIQLLGGCKLVYEDRVLAGLDKSRLQSLLAYLILNRDTSHARSRLAFLYWPDSSEAQAHTNLRKLIYQLRQVIPNIDDFVRMEGKTIQWRNDALYQLDVAEFDQAIAANDLKLAMNLYQGNLLPECDDDWVLVERERLRRVFIRAIEALLEQLESSRQVANAIELGQRLLQTEPLREEGYCRLMRLYALEGDRSNVVRTYESCVSILRDQLSIAPSAATYQIYQECLRAEPRERPPSRRSAAENSGLPVHLSRFIGRVREIADVKRLLEYNRLVTLTGAGGSGKTRLALQTATECGDRFRDGVTWVDLALLSDPALVPQAIALALGLGEWSDRMLIEIISDHLRSHHMLLLLDNCEHLVAACARIADTILSACPDQHILATSREVLNIGCETVWIVPSMSVPDVHQLASNWETTPIAALTSYDAIGLYVERASMVNPSFKIDKHNGLAIAQICHRLDGIPLAIELAAGKSKLLSPEQIAGRLTDRFSLLVGGSRISLPRYQTLKAAIDWSYELLSVAERILFRRLAVFTGDFSLEAVEAICANWQADRHATQTAATVATSGGRQMPDDLRSTDILPLFSQLVEKSLVVVEDRCSKTRYRLLETIREYALDKLREAGEEHPGRTRHLHYFRDLAESLEPNLALAWPSAVVAQLEREYHNIHTALVWGVADGKNAESVLRLVSLVPDFWYARKEFTSVQNGIRKLLENPELVVPARVRGFALISFGSMSAFFPAGFPEAHESFERALKIFRELNDKRGIACALYTIGFIKAEMFDLEGSRRYLEESLACLRALDDRYGVAVVLHDVGHVMSWQGEPGLGRALIEEGRAALKEFGVLGWAARATLFLGHIARREGDYERARSLYLEAGTLSDDDKHLLPLRSFMGALVIGFLAAAEKQYERAVRLFGAAERLASDLGTSITPMDRVEYDEYVAQARRALGDAGFKEAFESGRKLTMEQAILLTLTVVQTPSPVAELTLSAQH